MIKMSTIHFILALLVVLHHVDQIDAFLGREGMGVGHLRSTKVSPESKSSFFSSLEEDITTTETDNTNAMDILSNAVEAKGKESEDSIIGALRSAETMTRQQAKPKNDEVTDGSNAAAEEVASNLRSNLPGEWQLMLVTDKRLEKVIYLPVTNLFTLRDMNDTNDDDQTGGDAMMVENAIVLGKENWKLVSFQGIMFFDSRKRQGLFDYNRLGLFNGWVDIPLKPGQAEQIVSTVETRATPKGKKKLFGAYETPSPNSKLPFFNFFVANDQIAAARGSVGGFALWKRRK